MIQDILDDVIHARGVLLNRDASGSEYRSAIAAIDRVELSLRDMLAQEAEPFFPPRNEQGPWLGQQEGR